MTGERTELVRPHLQTLAGDPIMFIWAEVATTIAASLGHARADALAAFTTLMDDAGNALFATVHTYRLMQYIGNVNPDVISPVITRRLNSLPPGHTDLPKTLPDGQPWPTGGGAVRVRTQINLGTSAAVMLTATSSSSVLRTIDDVRKVRGRPPRSPRSSGTCPATSPTLDTLDTHVRAGVAGMCDHTSNPDLATETLTGLMNHKEDEVRKAVASLAPRLRGMKLRPFAGPLSNLIASDSYPESTPQLFPTLQQALAPRRSRPTSRSTPRESRRRSTRPGGAERRASTRIGQPRTPRLATSSSDKLFV